MFNNKEYAKEIGILMLGHFRLTFAREKAFDADNFNFPFGFWNDPYIVGQVLGIASNVVSTNPKTKDLSSEDQRETVIIALQFLCGENWEEVVNDCELYSDGVDADSDLFKLGTHHARLYFDALQGVMEGDLNDPILIEAVNSVAKMNNIGFYPGREWDINHGELASVIYSLTLLKYIRENFVAINRATN